jgi:hypothetical protein
VRSIQLLASSLKFVFLVSASNGNALPCRGNLNVLASTCIAVYSCRKSKTRFLLFFLIVRSGLRTVELYLQILKPCYLASINFQMAGSSIADTIPTVLRLLHTYAKMDVSGPFKNLCVYLIKTIGKKFAYELKSNEYQVKNNILLNVADGIMIIFKIFKQC